MTSLASILQGFLLDFKDVLFANYLLMAVLVHSITEFYEKHLGKTCQRNLYKEMSVLFVVEDTESYIFSYIKQNEFAGLRSLKT